MELTYNVSTYSDVVAAMKTSESVTLAGVPDSDPIPCSAKIYGCLGWFEIQFEAEDGTIYLFSSVNNKWGKNDKVAPSVYGDDYDGSVQITNN